MVRVDEYIWNNCEVHPCKFPYDWIKIGKWNNWCLMLKHEDWLQTIDIEFCPKCGVEL